MKLAHIGLIGLGVMGENLALNMLSRGYRVAVYNRTVAKTTAFVSGRARDLDVVACDRLDTLVAALQKPRMLLMMVKAGPAVDQLIDTLAPLLEPGDVLIDGGNTHFTQTQRRVESLGGRGIHFVGAGISGGERGALEGPSMMPGGSEEAWPVIRDLFQSIAALAPDGIPCCAWIGPGGSGHFVKMVHNGIEYADMQIIGEAYHIMRDGLGLSTTAMRDVFVAWNRTELDSYLIDITGKILGFQNEEGTYVLDLILDAAGQKGTGQWTSQSALDLGVPLDLISEAVFARFLSAAKEDRVRASHVYETGQTDKRLLGVQPEPFVEALRLAVYASKIISYAQGYALMQAAARQYTWPLDYAGIAMIWRAGCIIRSPLLEHIRQAYLRQPDLPHLILDPFFRKAIEEALPAWRRVVAQASEAGLPVPALSAALQYFHGLTCAHLPANLLQAQRDFFGAHTYERIDQPRGRFFHTEWPAD